MLVPLDRWLGCPKGRAPLSIIAATRAGNPQFTGPCPRHPEFCFKISSDHAHRGPQLLKVQKVRLLSSSIYYCFWLDYYKIRTPLCRGSSGNV